MKLGPDGRLVLMVRRGEWDGVAVVVRKEGSDSPIRGQVFRMCKARDLKKKRGGNDDGEAGCDNNCGSGFQEGTRPG